MVKRIREANHTIVNSGMYRTRALCTRQKFSLYLQTSHGSRRTKSIRGTSQREDSNLWECFRCRGGDGGFRSTADFVRGSRTPSRAHVPVKSARKKKRARASCHWPLGPTRQALPTKLRVRPRAAPALFCFFSCSPSPAAPLRREPPKP